jgi:FG-GAP repeat
MRNIFAVSMLCCIMSIYAASQGGLKQLAVLEPSNAGPDDYFGYSVAVSGNVIVANGNNGVCVFVKPANGWRDMKETATLTASDGTLLESAAINGNTIVAAGQDGAAYVFVEPADGWANMTQTAKLTATGAGLGFLGISISGNTVVAGAPDAQIGANQGQGAAYIFVEPAGGWVDMTQTAELTAADGASGDALGYAAVIDGGTVVAGAPNASLTGGYNQGATYVFVEPAGGWIDSTETAKLTASNASSVAGLGKSVAIEANTIVSGAPYQLDANEQGGGAVYVFVEPAQGWASTTQTAELTPTNPVSEAAMGSSVAISGNLIAAGSPGTFTISKRQLAYEFLKPAGGWVNTTQSAVEGPTKAPGYAEFGYSVSSGGGTVAVGAPGSDYTSYEGLVYVFGP